MGLPHVPSAVRARLLGDAVFAAACGGRCTVKKAPADVSRPFAVVQIPGGVPMDDHGWVLRPLIQVNAWCPDGWTAGDPDLVVWDIIAAAKQVLGSSDFETYTDSRGSMTYRVRLTDGPLPMEDISRGDGVPLQGYALRAELVLQHT